MSYNLLKGKKRIIFGALDSNSIAWKTAERVHEEGGQFVLTNAPVAMRMGQINELAEKTGSATAALLRVNGFGVIDGGEIRVNQLVVWGVNATMGNFTNYPESFQLQGNEVAINENLASLSGLKIGDEFLLRVDKLNTFPANTPFVSEKESTVSFRVSVARILKTDELGNFNLRNIQSAP